MAYKKNVWKSKDRITKEKLNNIEKGIYEAHRLIGEDKDLSLYQLKEDNSLLTSNKNITGAINELFQSTNITGKILTIDNKKYILSKDNNGNITATRAEFSITNNLTNVSNNNSTIKVDYGNSYSATITPNSGYELLNVSITMGGTNITSSVYTYQNGNAVINIPSITGNVVITVQATASSSSGGSGGNPGSGDVLSYMTYGKGISQTTAEIRDNPECWATINPVTIKNGTTYTISVDGTFLWVLAIDDSGNPVVPFLTTGTNSNPQSFTFTATTSKIKFGCYDPNHTVTYCTLTESSSSGGSGGSGGNPGSGTSYTITRNLSNCTSNNTSSSVNQGSSYSATITPNSGYTLSSITVTMNGTDITDTAVNIKTDTSNTNVSGETLSVSGETLSVSGEALSISGAISEESLSVSETSSNTTRYAVVNISNVTGDVVIVAQATATSVEPVTYTITRNLTNCTSSNTANSVNQGASYSATVTPNSGYELMNVAITMGGTNVTSTVYTYQNGNAVINIPNVTGNVVITVQATASSSSGGGDTGGGSNPGGSGSNPVSGDVLSYMTYGKGISQTTAEIRDNAECWATVNPVTVTNGTTYTISVDGTFLWVLAIDDSGNPVVPFLTTGTNSNPQSFTFTATTSKIKFGCYDPNHAVTYCTLTASSSSGGSGGNPGSGTSYTITRNLTNCTSSNTTGSVTANSSYSTTITANNGYTLGSITVTMGGSNITSSAVSGNRVNISNVTGNIVISCTATSSSSGGTTPPSSGGSDLTGTYLFFGDSICRGGGANNYGYPEAVKAKQPSMTALNYSVSGTCIAKNDSYDVRYPSILSKIQGSTPYADYIVLEGGFNDSWGQRNPLGTLKSGSAPTTASAIKTYSASLNEYQYTDALEKCICEIKLKYWGKKIFFVVPHTVNAATYANTYHLRAIEVCKKWGVIVIDLRNCGMPATKDGTYNVDGTHPSAAGYDKYFAPNIIKVLKANK